MDKIVGGVFSQIGPDEAAIIKLNSRLGSIGGLEIFKVSKIINFLQNMLNTCVSEENDESAMFREIQRFYPGATNEVIELDIQNFTQAAEGDRFQGMVNLMSSLEERQQQQMAQQQQQYAQQQQQMLPQQYAQQQYAQSNMGGGGKLSGAEKTAMGYALGAILAATKTPLERANLLDNPSSLVNIELSMFNNLLASKANMRTKLQSGFSGDYDTKLYKQFLRHISLNPPHNVGFMCADPRFKDFCSQDYKNVNMFEVLNTDPMWQGQALNEMGVASKNEWRAQQLRFWMSNAVNAPNTINYLKGNFFCSTQEVADNQPTCSTAQKSKEKEGLEWGIIDVIIHDGAKYSGNNSSGQKMQYRIRAVPMGKDGDDIPSELHISAYVKVGDQVLINRSDGQKGTGWPDDPTPLNPRNGPIVCPLDGRKPVPMDATTCLKTILETLSSPPFDTIPSYEQLINILCDYDRGQEFRRALLEKSFVKGLGDFLQEVNGITMNSGYVDGTRRTAPPNDVTIVPPYSLSEPRGYRLQLSNDRPSGIRALLFLLYGSGDIPKNSVAGYLTEHKELGAKWAVAGRMKGGKRKTRKIKRKKRKSKRKVIKKQRKSIHRKRKKRKSKNRRIKH